MRNFFACMIVLGLASMAFSSPEDDWEEEIVADSTTNSEQDSTQESEPESPVNQTKEGMRTGPIYFGELIEEDVSTKPDVVKPESESTPLFIGISLALDMYSENYLDGHYARHCGIFADHYGFDIGFLVGFDLYNWLSFQTGLNFIFHHSYYDLAPDSDPGYYLEKKELYRYMLDIPAQFRFAIPLNNDIARPFASYSLHIRKPLLASGYKEGGYYEEEDFSDFYALIEWDFMEYLGFGVELYRHFTIQYQLLLVSIRTYGGKAIGPYDAGVNTWRLNLEYTW